MQRRDEVTIENLDIASIVEILDEFPVTLAILFGSYARDEATKRSDIDLAIEFDDSLTSPERTQNRIALIERLSVTLETDEIDVIPLSNAPSSLLDDILTEGILIDGSMETLDDYRRRPREQRPHTHTERLKQFDDLLTDLEQVV